MYSIVHGPIPFIARSLLQVSTKSAVPSRTRFPFATSLASAFKVSVLELGKPILDKSSARIFSGVGKNRSKLIEGASVCF